jgi:hypothetical protein
MKTLIALATFAALALVGASTAHAGVQTGASGQGLIRKYYSVAPGETLEVRTSDCTGSEDTVLYLLTPVSGAAYTTRAFNDDAAGLGWCSQAAFKNTGSTTVSVTAVIFAYGPSKAGTTDIYYAKYTGTPAPGQAKTFVQTDNDLAFGGVRWATGWNQGATACLLPAKNVGSTLLTKPIGGSPIIADTVLFALNRTVGATSYFDDDSGIAGYSSLDMTSKVACTSGCDVVAGGYAASATGPIAIWQNSGCEADGDGVADDIEAAYGTSPSLADYDGDGITDRQELIGLTDAPTAGIEPADVLPEKGADPGLQDLFVQVDFMSDASHSHAAYADLATDLNKIFFDDWTWSGRAIRVHLEPGAPGGVGHWEGISYSPCTNASVASRVSFYALKATFFPARRNTVYHYVVLGHRLFTNESTTCDLWNPSGLAEILGNDVIVSFGSGSPTTGAQLGTHIHELGHNLNLTHNDNGQNDGANSCVHTSPMNYRYQMPGWGTSAVPAHRRYSYSRGACDAAGLGCSNTCNASACVPVGEASPKQGCTSTSHGATCDCDLAEWSRVELRFQGDSDAADGATAEALARYLDGGGEAQGRAHWALVAQKRARLVARGLREGVDFVMNPRNGKFYAAER